MPALLYHAFNLIISSEYPLRRFALAQTPGASEASIVCRPAPKNLAQPTQSSGVFFQANSQEYLLDVPGVARYYVVDGAEIWLESAAGAASDSVETFLQVAVLPALLLQRGLLALNASVVVTAKGAVILSGPSPSGKSSLAAALAQRGYSLLADGVCALDFNRLDCVLPEYPGLALWPDACQALAIQMEDLARQRPEIQRLWYPVIEGFSHAPQPPLMMYLLQPAHNANTSSQKLGPLEAFRLLAANLHQPLLFDTPEHRHKIPTAIAAIQKRIPMRALNLAHRVNWLAEAVALLESEWAA